MRHAPRLLAIAIAACTAMSGCSGDDGAPPSSPNTAGSEDDYTASDFSEDTVLPYKSGWLDAPKALSGIGQFDRLKGTIHDDAKCSTMVAIAAAVVGGEEKFLRLVDATERRRDGKSKDDAAIIARVRDHVAAQRLTPRDIHELTEVITRAYKVMYGAEDAQIAEMIRASGYAPVKVGSKVPAVLVDHLAENEVVPLGTVAENIPHITLIWKDARGTVRIYDSDDIHGSHVLPRGSAAYNTRVNAADSSWDLAEKYR